MIVRRSARVLVTDPEGRLLLFHCDDPIIDWNPRWITPGGGVHGDEPMAEAASRELQEETGYAVTPSDLGSVVAVSEGEAPRPLPFDYCIDSYFHARVDSTAVDTSAQEEHERNVLTHHRWWTVAELGATTERLAPLGLADLVPRLIRGDIPQPPVTLPWHHAEG